MKNVISKLFIFAILIYEMLCRAEATFQFVYTDINGKNCYHLTEVSLPSSLKIIEDYCFCDCSNLPKIKLPKNLEYLGNKCFRGYRSLSALGYSSNIRFYGEECFDGYTNLSRLIKFNGVAVAMTNLPLLIYLLRIHQF
jgi:hypothetical protein